MARVRNRVASRRRRKKVLKLAKGYFGARSRLFRTAQEAVNRAQQYAYRDRRVRKREFRKTWIMRINAAVRAEGMKYSEFIYGPGQAGIDLDRKALAHLALDEPDAFSKIVGQVKAQMAA